MVKRCAKGLFTIASEADAKITITPLDTPVRRKRRSRDVRSGGAAPYLFILPFGILFILFFIVPICYAFYQSLFSLQCSGLGLGGAETVFSGLKNYRDAITDSKFLESIGRMILFGVVQIPVMIGLGLLC